MCLRSVRVAFPPLRSSYSGAPTEQAFAARGYYRRRADGAASRRTEALCRASIHDKPSFRAHQDEIRPAPRLCGRAQRGASRCSPWECRAGSWSSSTDTSRTASAWMRSRLVSECDANAVCRVEAVIPALTIKCPRLSERVSPVCFATHRVLECAPRRVFLAGAIDQRKIRTKSGHDLPRSAARPASVSSHPDPSGILRTRSPVRSNAPTLAPIRFGKRDPCGNGVSSYAARTLRCASVSFDAVTWRLLG